ncbi:hypothetical protein CENSYa_0069 [Cenarchaeum symbiosum A]|uniref:Uncharacterized protein n=1 Tax=Cenarchaeum symbiosum (strain A) TaxID=414004 RepID=A0RTP8_CENSY|nr:hypothetical protein CENSYa_0069 [Cenarchaeum symbiosum A]
MVRPVIIALGAVPAIVAVLIAIPLLTQPEIPSSAANPSDRIEIEYTRHQLRTVSHGVTERTGSHLTEILIIDDDGSLRYTVTEDGVPVPEVAGSIDGPTLKRLEALIKETGFLAMPSDSFPITEGIDEYQKSSVRVTLNGVRNQIHWPEQNATERTIPPIVTRVGEELDAIMDSMRS